MKTEAGDFAKKVLEIAAAIEADERAIIAELRSAVHAGNSTRLLELLDRMERLPAAEVLPEHADGDGGGVA
jgi:hypothetical protein